MTPLVDADGLIYLAGFAVEKTLYQEVKDDLPVGPVFESKADLVEAGIEEFFTFIEREPLSHALQIVKNKLEAIQEKCGAFPVVMIRGKDQKNFRFEVAQEREYKGNRDARKPEYYDQIVQYLKDYWFAQEITDHEVDDEVSIRAHEMGAYYTVCSPDKDLDQIPGWHWNYKQEVEYYVEPEDAYRWFLVQTLQGDSADNIPGAYRIGAKKAEAIIDEVLSETDNRVTHWERIVDTYRETQENPKCPYINRDPAEVATEMARLVYLLVSPDEVWEPPNETAEAEGAEASGAGYQSHPVQEEETA